MSANVPVMYAIKIAKWRNDRCAKPQNEHRCGCYLLQTKLACEAGVSIRNAKKGLEIAGKVAAYVVKSGI